MARIVARVRVVGARVHAAEVSLVFKFMVMVMVMALNSAYTGPLPRYL